MLVIVHMISRESPWKQQELYISKDMKSAIENVYDKIIDYYEDIEEYMEYKKHYTNRKKIHLDNLSKNDDYLPEFIYCHHNNNDCLCINPCNNDDFVFDKSECEHLFHSCNNLCMNLFECKDDAYDKYYYITKTTEDLNSQNTVEIIMRQN